MIRQETAEAAIAIAEEFDKRGLQITFADDSLLHALHTSATVDFNVPAPYRAEGYTPTGTQIQAESSFVPLGAAVSAHDDALDQCVGRIAQAVRQHVSFARNTVSPLVKELADRVQVALQAMPQEATFNPTIVRVDLPEPMLSNVFQSMVDDYRRVQYAAVRDVMPLPEHTGEEVQALLTTGVKLVDNDIQVWAQRLGASFFETVWATVFTRSPTARGTFAKLIDDRKTGPDAALAVYLLAKKLLDNPPEGVSGSLADYRDTLQRLIEQAGLRLIQAYDDKSRQEKNGLLVLSHDKSEVRVVAQVYDQWLGGGANVASLFGNLLGDKPRFHVHAIDEEAQDHIATWERYNAYLTSTLADRRHVDALKVIQFKLEQLVAENLSTCFATAVETTQLTLETPIVQEALAKANDYLRSLSPKELENTWQVCTVLIAAKVFFYTDAYDILMGVDEALAENPGMEPAEAALLSMSKYVVRFMAEQLSVTTI